MQYSAVTLKQKIPYFGKRDANSDKINAQKEKFGVTLESAKVKLIEALKITAYTLWQIEEELKIRDASIKLTEQNIQFYTSYSISQSNAHLQIMSAELFLADLKIKTNALEKKRSGLYKKLSYLSAMEVDSLELSMDMPTPHEREHYKNALANNSTYKLKEAQTKEANAELHIKELAAYVDPSVQIGYYRRESFKDYASVGVAFSLPIYGTQKYQEEASKKELLATKSETLDYKNLLDAEFEEKYAILESAYQTYIILQNDSFKALDHMFELTNTSIQNGTDLVVYTELLQKKLTLDAQNIEAIALYYKTLASVEAMIGEK
ncbi:MAG: TolC family protein, partial [Sulfurimonas sp.]